MDTLHFHEMKITWLNGGITKMDGGAMFGPVPKAIWQKRYPANERNQIELPTEPMLLQYQNTNYLIDAGIGFGRLTEKQKRNFGVSEQSHIEHGLAELKLSVEDIDVVIMTHLHFDHVTGLSKETKEGAKSLYPNATIYVNKMEWVEIRQPNRRSKSTYWQQNWKPIQEQVTLFDDQIELVSGIELIHTGGHSKGLSVVKLTQNSEVAVHLSDIFPTHAHQNPLWVTAYDDYPLESISAKEEWIEKGVENEYKFLFYHDAYYRMVQWNKSGKQMLDTLKRAKKANIPLERN